MSGGAGGAPERIPDSILRSIQTRLRRRYGLALDDERLGKELCRFAATESSSERRRARMITPATCEASLDELMRGCLVHETYFLRDPAQLESVVNFCRARLHRPVRIWSAACSTGEEAWSMALLLAEAGVEAEILATDIDPDVVAFAKRGVYSGDRVFRHLPEPLRRRYFQELPMPVGRALRVQDGLRRSVRFGVLNLATDLPPPAENGWDVILCRNVLIYLSRELARRLEEVFSTALATGGRMVFGAADRLMLLTLERGGLRSESLERGARTSAALERDAGANRGAMVAGPSRPGPGLEALLDRGLYATAEHALEGLQPGDRSAVDWLNLGNLRLRRHALDEAREAYRCVSGGPRSEASYLRGLVEFKSERDREAAGCFEAALTPRPDLWPARLLLAATLRRLGHHRDARFAGRRACETLLRLGRGPDWLSRVDLVPGVHSDVAVGLDIARSFSTDDLTVSHRAEPLT